MRRILLLVEYDGTAYVGWQVQPNGPSVQAVIEARLAELLGQEVRLHSSGRTDAGVHARGMAAHFDTASTLPLRAFREGLNSRLPYDIAIREAREIPSDFHARFSARKKWYRYTIYRGAVRSPLSARTSWHLRGPLDIEAMRQAAGTLVGEHDFKAFRSTGCAAKTTVRALFAVDLVQEDDFLYLDFHGSGFLKNMVRMLVGTLVQVGLGRRPATDLQHLLMGQPDLKPGPTAPPQGLCLMQVWYGLPPE